jgi:hypothetical protein
MSIDETMQTKRSEVGKLRTYPVLLGNASVPLIHIIALAPQRRRNNEKTIGLAFVATDVCVG